MKVWILQSDQIHCTDADNWPDGAHKLGISVVGVFSSLDQVFAFCARDSDEVGLVVWNSIYWRSWNSEYLSGASLDGRYRFVLYTETIDHPGES